MSTTATLAPSLANISAATRPIPAPAPVMSATLPSSRAIGPLLRCLRRRPRWPARRGPYDAALQGGLRNRPDQQGNDHVAEDLIIGGGRRPALGGVTFETLDPATGLPHATVAKASPADVDRAVTVAQQAFDDGRGAWSSTNATVRGRVLHKVADLLRERAEEFAKAEAVDAGHPIGDARWEAEAAARPFE